MTQAPVIREHVITSAQNPRLKEMIKLRERKGRRISGLFLCEGRRELERALSCGYQLNFLATTQDASIDWVEQVCESVATIEVLRCAEPAWEKLAMREGTVDYIGVLVARDTPREALGAEKPGFWLIADGIEKPGNLGAMLRSCDGAGASGVILTNAIVDVYNPNVIRASQGTVFSTPIVGMTLDEVKRWAADFDVAIYAADPKGQDVTHGCSFVGDKFAFVIGNEASGVDPAWNEGTRPIKLPMCGVADSLNAAVTAGILLYEARRQSNQRQKKATD